ncbi:MAG: flagellar type III secretion system protein FlhB [Planctomycetota bacterium]|nr:flagellar type III secretion system protein FlhB [Planctomycetota bacterium]
MAEEGDKSDKTEDATPKRRDDAREQGQVAMSADAIAAAGLIASAILLVAGGGMLATSTGMLVRGACLDFGALGRAEFTENEWTNLITRSIQALSLPTLAIIVPLTAVIVLAAYAQVGLQITPKAIAWNPSRLNPIQGWSKVFSVRGAIRTLSASTKITIVTIATCWAAWNDVPLMSSCAGADLGPALVVFGKVFTHCSIAALIAICSIAMFDLVYQRWQHDRDLRMSKKDIQEEFKSTDGDPHVKAKIRSIQREMSRRRMMSDVPKATVVITNPTHYAVALRYEKANGESGGRAPIVVAKGVDVVAQKIKAVALEAGVPLHEDVPLARALHAQVEIGQEIPEQLFQAVAGVLAYVYRIQKGAQSLERADS